MQVTVREPEVLQSVSTELPCLMSRMLALVTPTDDPLLTAAAPVKVTESKFAKVTSAPPDSWSSTIHSASYSQSWFRSLLKLWLTLLPVVRFSRVATPAAFEDAVCIQGEGC